MVEVLNPLLELYYSARAIEIEALELAVSGRVLFAEVFNAYPDREAMKGTSYAALRRVDHKINASVHKQVFSLMQHLEELVGATGDKNPLLDRLGNYTVLSSEFSSRVQTARESVRRTAHEYISHFFNDCLQEPSTYFSPCPTDADVQRALAAYDPGSKILKLEDVPESVINGYAFNLEVKTQLWVRGGVVSRLFSEKASDITRAFSSIVHGRPVACGFDLKSPIKRIDYLKDYFPAIKLDDTGKFMVEGTPFQAYELFFKAMYDHPDQLPQNLPEALDVLTSRNFKGERIYTSPRFEHMQTEGGAPTRFHYDESSKEREALEFLAKAGFLTLNNDTRFIEIRVVQPLQGVDSLICDGENRRISLEMVKGVLDGCVTRTYV